MPKKLNAKKGSTLWQERFDAASSNQTKLFKRFADNYDALYAIPGKVPSPWKSKVYLPVLARQVWALIAKMLAMNPGWLVTAAQDAEDAQAASVAAEKAQYLLERDYDNPEADETIKDRLFEPLVDAVVTGTGMAKLPWKVYKKLRRERVIDEYGNVDPLQYKEFEKITGQNEFEGINIFNVFVSPACKSSNLYKAPWIIIKETKSLSDLKKVNSDSSVEIYRNLDLVSLKVAETEIDAYNQSRNRLLTDERQVDETVDTVTLYECYEADKLCTYAESSDPRAAGGWVLLREQSNPYWHGRYPLIKFHMKKRPYSFWGEGLFDVTLRLQAAYNDIFNHYLDAQALANDPMLIAPESSDINDYIVQPGEVISYRGQQAPEPFKHAQPDAGAVQMILGFLDQAVEGVTISNYASGIANSDTDKTQGTATGIVRLQEAAGDIVSFFKSNFKSSILQMGKMMLSNNQQFLNDEVALPELDMEDPVVRPVDLQRDLRVSIDDSSMQPSTKEEQRQANQALRQELMSLQQAAMAQAGQYGTEPLLYDFSEMAKETAEDYGSKDFDKVILNQEEVQQLQMQQQEQLAQQVMQGEQIPEQEAEAQFEQLMQQGQQPQEMEGM